MPEKSAEKAQQPRRWGRPRTPVSEARRNRVVTLVTDAEFEELTAFAQNTGQSVSALVRQLISEFLQNNNHNNFQHRDQ